MVAKHLPDSRVDLIGLEQTIKLGAFGGQSEPTADKNNEIHHIFTQTDTPRWNKTGDTVTVILFNVSDSKPLKAFV